MADERTASTPAATSAPPIAPQPPHGRGGLWRLAAGPAVWALHFLLSYVTVAIHCAKATRFAAPLDGARTALWIYTALALALIAAFGIVGWRQHRHGESPPPHDAPTPHDRHRFLGFATLLLCGLSFVAVLYAAFAIAVIGTCR